MNKLAKLAIIIGSALAATICAQADQYTLGNTVYVAESGVNPDHVVSIISPTLGSLTVYAGVTQLTIAGIGTIDSFCIDPYQFSSSASNKYTVTNLASAPLTTYSSVMAPAMGATAASTINYLWAYYYTSALTNADVAAGLQIAIWETVAPGFQIVRF